MPKDLKNSNGSPTDEPSATAGKPIYMAQNPGLLFPLTILFLIVATPVLVTIIVTFMAFPENYIFALIVLAAGLASGLRLIPLAKKGG